MMDRWIPYDDPDWNAWECSACGAVQYLESGTPLENEWLYCPHCGKPMNYEEGEREMTADERIESLLNRFGQTIADLPKSSEVRYAYTEDHRDSAAETALAWNEVYAFTPTYLKDYICHLADVIDRMEIALCTAQRVTSCKSCQHHKALLAKGWDNVPCSECNSSQCRLHYQISDEYLSDLD